VTVAEELSEDIVGRVMIGDQGYDSDKYRRALEVNNNKVVIPGRRNRKKEMVGERCCSPNNSMKEPKVNNHSDNDFMHPMVFGKTYAFSH
jgi:hypothetical protein